MNPRVRLYVDAPLTAGAQLLLADAQSHYVRHVMRLKDGDAVAAFNGNDGEWRCVLCYPSKKQAALRCESLRAKQHHSLPITMCFAPIKGGRVESMIEKATELGAQRIIPVRTTRTVAKHVNLERLTLVAREAAEQCERLDLPEILPFTPLPRLLADWPAGTPLFYGDESGVSPKAMFAGAPPTSWGTLTGPEGGFTAEEFAMLQHQKDACGVGLGPRILRADTACITLLAVTAQCWGDWQHAPHFNPAS